MPASNLRQISVSLPPELVSIVDVATPTHRSRSVVIAEATQELEQALGQGSDGSRPPRPRSVDDSGSQGGRARFVSKVLRAHLDEVGRVFPYVATCGPELDTIPIADDDIFGQFCRDTIKEMALYTAIAHLDSYVKEAYALEKLVSMNPGSGDVEVWPIEQQKDLFAFFGDVQQSIGVVLTDSCLMVPNKSNLDLETTNGGISVEDVEGEIRVEATNGGLYLARLAGDVSGATTNGGLEIELTGKKWNGRGMDVRSTNGGVSMEVPENYSANLEAGTVNGGISIDFPITVQGNLTRSIKATLGDGGPRIRVKTTNGGIHLTKI